MKRFFCSFLGIILFNTLIFGDYLNAVPSFSANFQSLKQYQRLWFKGPSGIRYTLRQVHSRQALLSFSQLVEIKRGQNFPSFISLTPAKGSSKKFIINFGKPYRVADFQKGNSICLDLYPQKNTAQPSPLPAPKLVQKKEPPSNPLMPSNQPKEEEFLTIRKSTMEEGLIFEYKNSFPLAAFLQGTYLYILWPSSIELKKENLPLIPGMIKIEPLNGQKKASGVLLTIKPYCQPCLRKEKEKWVLTLKKSSTKENYRWYVDYDPQSRASFVIEDVKAEAIDHFIDSLTGKDLRVVYTNNDRKEITSPIEMIEMEIFPSLVGLIVDPYQSTVYLNSVKDNVVISTPEGFTISSKEERSRNIAADTQDFFKFYAWEKDKASWFEKRAFIISRLQQSDPEHLIEGYFDLVRFYLSTGFFEEAFSFLQKVVQKDKSKQEDEVYLSLLGVTQVLRNHYREAITIFKDNRFSEESEITLWSALSRLALGQEITNPEIFEEKVEFLKKYPAFIKMKFINVIVPYFLKNQQIKNAQKFLNLVEATELEATQKEELRFLRSLMMYKEGDIETALSVWQQLGEDFKTRVGIEANLSLLDHQIVHKLLSEEQVVKKLKSLRYRWRDDEIELRIVQKLIGYYLQQKRYKSALNEMQYLENNFSSFIDTQEIKLKIQEHLVKLYSTSNQKDFPLLMALGLYKDYKNYFPKDDRMKVIQSSLAEKLFSIGLGDKAIEILRDQLTQASPAEKAQIGTRIAEIYLMNENPQDVLNILGETANDSISSSLLEHRQLMEAQSLGLLKKYNDALGILQGRKDKKAMLLKRDLLLTANRWIEAGEILQEFLEQENIDKGVLTADQSQLILDLAVTAALSKKFPLLNNLRLRYFALMQKTELASLFDVVTKLPDTKKVTTEDSIRTLLEKTEEFELLLMAYQTRLRKNIV